MIRLNQLVASYTTVRGSVKAVEGVDLEIPAGNIVGSPGNPVAAKPRCSKSFMAT